MVYRDTPVDEQGIALAKSCLQPLSPREREHGHSKEEREKAELLLQMNRSSHICARGCGEKPLYVDRK